MCADACCHFLLVLLLLGWGCLQAIANVNTVIGPALLGKNPVNQKEIDDFMVQELDGSKNEWGCACLLSVPHPVRLCG